MRLHNSPLNYFTSTSTCSPNNVKAFTTQTPNLLIKHGKINLRGLMRDFYKQVHPDLTRFSSSKAKLVNEKSLAELNSYIDLLERALIERGIKEELTITSKTLNFFKAYRSCFGQIYPERCIPFIVLLPTLRTSASYTEKEAIALSVIHGLSKEANSIDSSFSPSPKPNPIFSAKHSDRQKLTELWDTMTYETLHKESIFQPESLYKRYLVVVFHPIPPEICKSFENLLNTNRNTYLNIKRKKFFQSSQFEHKPNFGGPNHDIWDDESSIIKAGFHPDLLFYDKNLSHKEIKEGKNRLKGLNLTNETDIWLLYNTLKVIRNSNPAISIMIIPKCSSFGISRFGTLMIPSDFDLWQLVEYLEKNLDTIKRKRENIFKELQRCNGSS